MTNIPTSGGGFRVLDSNLGVSNIVPKALYRRILEETCDILIDVFKEHAGPLCSYSVLDDKFSNPDKPLFSKDGINILNSISFLNETQDGIRRLLSYCASSSNKAAGDGTTSAIIISIIALRLCLESPAINTTPYFKLVRAYRRFLKFYENSDEGTYNIYEMITKVFKDQINSGELDIEEIERKAVGFVAYSQALTSSHGDHELAQAVSKLFMYTPRDAWEYISFNRSIFEREEERFKFEYCTDQFETTAKVMNVSMLNNKLGGKIKYKSATLIPMPHPILMSQRDQFERLKGMIIDHIKNKKELLIIHTSNLDHMTTQLLNDIFDTCRLEGTPNETVAILRHEPVTDKINDISILNIIAGKMPTFATEPFNVFENVSVYFDQFTVKLNGLYENPTNSLIHPAFGDTDNTYLTDTVASIEEIMENYKNSGPSYSKSDDMKNFYNLHMKLKYTRRAYIVIGGLTFDSLSSVDVLEDALYASRSSLMKGFEIAAASGMVSKCLHVQDKVNDLNFCEDKHDEDLLIKEFARIFIYAVRQLKSIIYKQNIDNTFKLSSLTSIYDIYSDKIKDIVFMENTLFNYVNNYEDTSGESFISEKDIFIIQPTDINKTIIKRFGDLFLKLINVDKFIITGGVTLNKENN